MSPYQGFEWLAVALIVGWSLRRAWRTLVPMIRASLQRRAAGKACGSACGGCETGERSTDRP